MNASIGLTKKSKWSMPNIKSTSELFDTPDARKVETSATKKLKTFTGQARARLSYSSTPSRGVKKICKTSRFPLGYQQKPQNVDNSVDKLWISCGQNCGQLRYLPPLWIAVDKSPSYPQENAAYPQNHPQHFSLSNGTKPQISTFSTGPTIDSLSNQKVFMFVELKGRTL